MGVKRDALKARIETLIEPWLQQVAQLDEVHGIGPVVAGAAHARLARLRVAQGLQSLWKGEPSRGETSGRCEWRQ